METYDELIDERYDLAMSRIREMLSMKACDRLVLLFRQAAKIGKNLMQKCFILISN